MNTERNAEIITRGHYATESHFVVRMGEPDGVETTLAIRRVIREGNTRGTTREELQIEVTIAKHGDTRTSKAFGTIIATPQIADMIAAACATVREPGNLSAAIALLNGKRLQEVES